MIHHPLVPGHPRMVQSSACMFKLAPTTVVAMKA